MLSVVIDCKLVLWGRTKSWHDLDGVTRFRWQITWFFGVKSWHDFESSWQNFWIRLVVLWVVQIKRDTNWEIMTRFFLWVATI